jgi:hypothetical protein
MLIQPEATAGAAASEVFHSVKIQFLLISNFMAKKRVTFK